MCVCVEHRLPAGHIATKPGTDHDVEKNRTRNNKREKWQVLLLRSLLTSYLISRTHSICLSNLTLIRTEEGVEGVACLAMRACQKVQVIKGAKSLHCKSHAMWWDGETERRKNWDKIRIWLVRATRPQLRLLLVCNSKLLLVPLSLFLLLLHQQSVHKTDHEGGRGRYLHFQLPGNIHEAGQLARN